jgi:hypothetical protein
MIETAAASDDEFYIGYADGMPRGIARHVASAVVLFACGAAGALGIFLAAQQTLAPSRFEFGVVKPVSGVLRRDPYPSLQANGRRIWLVGRGKFGAEPLVNGVPDGPVTVTGSAIQRGRVHMLELSARSPISESRLAVGSSNRDSQLRLGVVTLHGEIVDSKCFLGVMNPAEGTVHRDCARRCLSGGIPPMLVVRDGAGREELVVLVSAAGQPLGRDVAPLAGRAVTVTGRLARDGDTWMLYGDAAAFQPD